MLISIAFFSFCYAFEINSIEANTKMLWLRIGYLGLSTISLFYMLFIISFAGKRAWLSRKVLILLFTLPALVLLANYTNDWHHQFYTSISVKEAGPFSILVLKRGFLYWLIIFYSYVFNLVATFILLQIILTKRGVFRSQSILMLFASLPPWIVNTLYVLRHSPQGIDLSAFGFFFTAIVMSIGLFQFHLLGFMPIALDNVFKSMHDGVILIDKKNHIINFNDAAKRIFVRLSGKVIGKDVKNVFHEYENLLGRIESDSIDVFNFSMGSSDEVRYLKATILPVKDKREIKIGSIIMIYDITNQTLSENELKQTNATKDKLFSIIAHDLRGPFGSIIGLLDILNDQIRDFDKDEISKMVEIISNQAHNTYRLVENLLFWSRSQVGQISFYPESVFLKNIVSEVAEVLLPSAALKNISIKTDIGQGLSVYADKEMLKIIIRNLVSNAIKFSNIGGYILISAKLKNEHAEILVMDNGIGMSADTISGLFHLTTQKSATGTSNEEGTRLGLIICKEFVEKQGGAIWVESEQSRGSIFHFTLPVSVS
jgi:PAS domain S-box-containing protein